MEFALNKKLIYFVGAYIGFFIFIVCAALDFKLAGVLFKILAICMFCCFCFKGDKSHIIDFEKMVLLLFGTIFSILVLKNGKMQGQYFILNIMCTFVMLGAAVTYFVRNHNGLQIKDWICDNGIILLIIACFGLMSMEVIDSWFMWDAAIYYAHPYSIVDVQGMVYNFDADFTNLDNLFLATHLSLGYSLWLLLFQLAKEGSTSVQIANIVLACISIFSYYQILQKLFGNRFSKPMLALATIPYAVSPFVLGLVGNLNVDSATMYFFVIFVACSLYHYEALEWTLAFFLCFTKETAVIYYAVYILGKIVCEYKKEYSFRLNTLIKFGFGNIRNYIYALPIILWGILLFTKQIWGGAISWSNEGINCFGIDISVIGMKVKQIFFLNFNWIFWAILLGGGNWHKKLNKTILMRMFPILLFGITVIAFGCFYITWTHARYIVPLIPVLYLAATVVIIESQNKNIFIIFNTLVSILLCVQSFYAIDPIMSRVFDPIYVGNGKVFDMKVSGSQRIGSPVVFNDCIVYNRQYMYWQEALIGTFKKAEYDGNMLIVLPENKDCVENALFGTRDGKVLWNVQEGTFEYYNESIGIPEQCKWVRTCHISDMAQTFDGNDLLYIIPGWTDVDMEFVSDNSIIRQGEVQNKGFNVKYMVMRVEDNLPLADGEYMVSPKQDSTLGICTNAGNGDKVFLQRGGMSISLEAIDNIVYHLNIGDYQVALDVPRGQIDSDGTVQVWKTNSTSGQRWVIEKTDGYYMICYKNCALTYNLDDNSIRLSQKTGDDNQLWLFSN